MSLPLLIEDFSHGQVSSLAGADKPKNLSILPQLRQELTAIEVHVLKCVAAHTCNHSCAIPYIAPNSHQFSVALALAAPDLRLLLASTDTYTSFSKVSFRLSGFGWRIVQRLFHVIPQEEVVAREIEFDKMRTMMRNDWEAWDERVRE